MNNLYECTTKELSNFWDNLEALMVAAGWRNEDLAAQLNVTDFTVRRIKEIGPRVDQYLAIKMLFIQDMENNPILKDAMQNLIFGNETEQHKLRYRMSLLNDERLSYEQMSYRNGKPVKKRIIVSNRSEYDFKRYRHE